MIYVFVMKELDIFNLDHVVKAVIIHVNNAFLVLLMAVKPVLMDGMHKLRVAITVVINVQYNVQHVLHIKHV